jgi:hypothetical protein
LPPRMTDRSLVRHDAADPTGAIAGLDVDSRYDVVRGGIDADHVSALGLRFPKPRPRSQLRLRSEA